MNRMLAARHEAGLKAAYKIGQSGKNHFNIIKAPAPEPVAVKPVKKSLRKKG